MRSRWYEEEYYPPVLQNGQNASCLLNPHPPASSPLSRERTGAERMSVAVVSCLIFFNCHSESSTQSGSEIYGAQLCVPLNARRCPRGLGGWSILLPFLLDARHSLNVMLWILLCCSPLDTNIMKESKVKEQNEVNFYWVKIRQRKACLSFGGKMDFDVNVHKHFLFHSFAGLLTQGLCHCFRT